MSSLKSSRHYALVMAGGEGTRLYPLSTPEKPKQFLTLFGDRSLLQHTYDRILKIFDTDKIWIATNIKFLQLVQEQLPEIPKNRIILETQKKNTAPCIALAAKWIHALNPKSVMGVFPCDHFIGEKEKFVQDVKQALSDAEKIERLFTFGIPPDAPVTEYGYIHSGDFVSTQSMNVLRFVEKPNAEKAQEYLADKKYLWNSGMFVWQTKFLLSEIEKYLPRMNQLLQAFGPADSFVQKNVDVFFDRTEKISIDYGVMEKSKSCAVLKANFLWNDLGSFAMLKKLSNQGLIQVPATITAYL